MTIVMPFGPVSCIGGTKYPHCIVLYCIVALCGFICQKLYSFVDALAVSIRAPDGDLSRFALEFSRPLWASVRSFISIHQVAPATALLLLLMLLRAWFIVICQVSQA